jgi:hypothetical protein
MATNGFSTIPPKVLIVAGTSIHPLRSNGHPETVGKSSAAKPAAMLMHSLPMSAKEISLVKRFGGNFHTMETRSIQRGACMMSERRSASPS